VTITRGLLTAVLLFTAGLLQVTVVNVLPLPGGGPDLVLLVLIGLALVGGPTYGAVTGFAAGLMVDLMPPVGTEVGRWALVFCLAGYIAGQVRLDARRSALIVLAVVAGLSAFTVAAFAGVGLLFGDERVTTDLFVRSLVSTVLYDLFLTPFVIPVVMALARRTESGPVRV
jgi:rod shape-determining protein MreD